MFINDCLNVNKEGHLTIGGVDTLALAQKYGTPLYVLDESVIRDNCRKYIDAFKKYYGGNGLPSYASKALCCKELCRIMKDENMGLDVVSGGELYTALSAGFPADRIHFHGNNKTANEIKMCLENGVGKIVVDNLAELELIDTMSKEYGKVTDISLRIKPGVDAHTHDYIRTGQIDSKFGFALENGEAIDVVKKATSYENISLKELHCHIGSQIFEIQPFVDAAEIMMDFIAKIKNELNFEIKQLNFGGGFGIKYLESDKALPFESFIEAVSQAVAKKAEEHSIDIPYIYIEPGRSIVCEAGITLYTIGGVKEIKDVRTYVSIDGGMVDNIRYALYKADYTVVNASKADLKAEKEYTVAGKCCESGDLIQENTKIADPQIGDTLAVLSTGAYNYSMASNYNRIPRPAVVMVKDGEDRLVVKRETYEDIIRNDI